MIKSSLTTPYHRIEFPLLAFYDLTRARRAPRQVINADISILNKSVTPRLPFCLFAGYSVLTYPNDSLTYFEACGWHLIT